MTKKLSHDEFDRRVQEAMQPAQNISSRFSPAIQQLRQTAKLRKPIALQRPTQAS